MGNESAAFKPYSSSNHRFYEHFLKGGLLLDFQNFKRKLYANFLDKRPSIYYVSKRTVWVCSKHGTFCWRSVVDQSICTHYSCFEKMGRFVTLKKNWVQNMGCKKQGAKNRVIVIQKEKKPGCLFSF